MCSATSTDGGASIAAAVSTPPSGSCWACNKLGALFVDAPATDTCRPFQEGSRGFTAGEAAVGFVVSGRPGGAYGRVLGGAMTHDGYHALSIAPDHEQIFRAFANAVDDAGVDPGEIAYVNAHGTGTRQCDTAEAAVLDSMFPTAEGIFSVKPLTGHCQAAAGGVELAASLYGFERGVIPAPARVAKG